MNLCLKYYFEKSWWEYSALLSRSLSICLENLGTTSVISVMPQFSKFQPDHSTKYTVHIILHVIFVAAKNFCVIYHNWMWNEKIDAGCSGVRDFQKCFRIHMIIKEISIDSIIYISFSRFCFNLFKILPGIFLLFLSHSGFILRLFLFSC